MSQPGAKRFERKPVVKKTAIQIKNFDEMETNYEENQTSGTTKEVYPEKTSNDKSTSQQPGNFKPSVIKKVLIS